MDLVIGFSNYFLPVVALVVPALLIKRFALNWKSFSIFILLSCSTSGVILFFAAWWGAVSLDIRLELLGVNLDAMNDFERYKHVSQEYRELARELYSQSMGIGWSLRAMFMIALTMPYSLLVFALYFLFSKFKVANKIRD